MHRILLEPISKLASAGKTRQKRTKKRSLHNVNEHFVRAFNAVLPSAAILRWVLTIFTLFALTGCTTTELKVVFVILNSAGEPEPTDSVDLIVGTNYGWVMYLDSPEPIHWQEEFILPAVPKVWGQSAAESNIHITERTEEPSPTDGAYIISNAWSVADGDPEGEYIFNISVDDKRIKQLKIQFRKPK